MPGAGIWPLLVGTGVLLGLSIPIAKAAAAAGVPALAYALWPAALASGVLALLAARRRGAWRPSLPLLRYAAISGFLGHAAPMTAVFWVSAQAGAGFASLAFTLTPVTTLAISLLVRHERFSALRALAVAIGFSGALVLVLGRGESMHAATAAVLLVPLIPIFIGGGNVYRALHTPPGTPAEWLAALSLAASSAMLLAAGAATGTLAFAPGVEAFAWIGAQALAMVVGYGMYFELIRRAEPVTFSFMGYVMMLTGVAVGVGLFGERLPLSAAPALLLIATAFLMIHRATRITPRNTSATIP
ncbi:MAG: DMT family transporter [bacterium]|jgi:drug/metabolite transporter (DMT)-like permease|nr:DMT family transporter [Betaproteobacteria bacterium]